MVSCSVLVVLSGACIHCCGRLSASGSGKLAAHSAAVTGAVVAQSAVQVAYKYCAWILYLDPAGLPRLQQLSAHSLWAEMRHLSSLLWCMQLNLESCRTPAWSGTKGESALPYDMIA